jgi:hypothetical protein
MNNFIVLSDEQLDDVQGGQDNTNVSFQGNGINGSTTNAAVFAVGVSQYGSINSASNTSNQFAQNNSRQSTKTYADLFSHNSF